MCIWLGFAVIFVLTVFPPYVFIRMDEGTIFAGWESIGHPRIDQFPIRVSLDLAAVVDYRRMLLEMGVGEAFVLALYLTWGRTQDEKKK
jgi:hypothetical protein